MVIREFDQIGEIKLGFTWFGLRQAQAIQFEHDFGFAVITVIIQVSELQLYRGTVSFQAINCESI